MTLKSIFQIFLLALAMLIAGYVRTAISPLQEAMRLSLHLSDNQMALLQGPIIGVPVTLTAIPLGLLIDRANRARLLLGLVTIAVAANFATAFARDFTQLLSTRAIAGVSALAILPVVYSLVADHFAPHLRGRMITVATIGQIVGNSMAFALGGELLVLAQAHSGDWRTALSWLAAPGVAVVLLMLLLREPPRLEEAKGTQTIAGAWEELRHTRTLILMLSAGIICAEIAIGAMIIWASPMFSRTYAAAPDAIGFLMGSGMLISGVLGPVIGGGLADYCQRTGGTGRALLFLVLLAALGAPASLFAFAPTFSWASALLMVSLTLMIGVAMMGITFVMNVVPDRLRGLCMSVLVAAILLFSLAVAPPLVSVLSNVLGGIDMIGKALSIVCVAAALGSTFAFFLARRYFKESVGAAGSTATGTVTAQ